MKVKPFYIRIADDMTPQVVQDAFDKCVDAGALAGDCVEGASSIHEYDSGYSLDEYRLFGVRDSKSTRLYDYSRDFGAGAQEITLDQLDEWLGLDKTETPEEKEAFDSMANDSELPNGSEWDGEGLPPVGVECEIYTYDSPISVDLMSWHLAKVLSIHDAGFGAENIVTYTCDWDPNFYTDSHPAANLRFRKPESPEQKAERERLEAAYDLYVESNNALGLGVDFADFEIDSAGYLAIVDKTGYRKAK